MIEEGTTDDLEDTMIMILETLIEENIMRILIVEGILKYIYQYKCISTHLIATFKELKNSYRFVNKNIFSSRPSSRSSYNDRDREYYMRSRDPYYAYNGNFYQSRKGNIFIRKRYMSNFFLFRIWWI